MLHNTILIRIRTEAISLFSSSPYVHGITHEMADRLCLTMLKQNIYIIRVIFLVVYKQTGSK